MLMVHTTLAIFNVLCRLLCSPLYVLVNTDTNNERTRWCGGESERETQRERDRERVTPRCAPTDPRSEGLRVWFVAGQPTGRGVDAVVVVTDQGTPVCRHRNLH